MRWKDKNKFAGKRGERWRVLAGLQEFADLLANRIEP
jgi:hypothetical protein